MSAAFGCGVTLRGQFWYFGGKVPTYDHQVSIDANLFLTEIYILR